MQNFYPFQENEDFILEQLRAPEQVKYPLSPEIIAILDKVRVAVP